MRTKTLLLTAAIGAAGVATSMAQVFSVNAVGYVKTTVPPNGFALVSNPLDAGAGKNTIAELFKGVPAGTQVYKYNNATGSYTIATYDDLDNAFLPPNAATEEVKPGDGVFVKNPGATPLEIIFVGEVPQGTLSNPLPKGLSIKASMVPQRGTAQELGFVGAPGDQVYQFRPATQNYHISTFDDLDNAWLPALTPIEVGEAVFISKVAAGTWNRTFSVNQ